MRLIKIGYSPYERTPRVIFKDIDSGKIYRIEWIMSKREIEWAKDFWCTGKEKPKYCDVTKLNKI